MHLQSILQVRMIHRQGTFTDWRSRLVYGVCYAGNIKSMEKIAELTGLDRASAVKNHLGKLRKMNYIEGFEVKKGKRHPPYIWVGVMSEDCPLTALENVVFWQWWHLDKPDVKGIARLLDIKPDTVRECRAALIEKGAAATDVSPIILKHPNDLADWWIPKQSATEVF